MLLYVALGKQSWRGDRLYACNHQPQARRFMLAHQNLWPPRELWGKSGVLEQIRRVHCIQFDPLNIVGRNPELVLQARVGNFQPSMLDELLYQDRKLLDGWDKMRSIIPVEVWPCFRRRREGVKNHHGRSRDEVDAIVRFCTQARFLLPALTQGAVECVSR